MPHNQQCFAFALSPSLAVFLQFGESRFFSLLLLLSLPPSSSSSVSCLSGKHIWNYCIWLLRFSEHTHTHTKKARREVKRREEKVQQPAFMWFGARYAWMLLLFFFWLVLYLQRLHSKSIGASTLYGRGVQHSKSTLSPFHVQRHRNRTLHAGYTCSRFQCRSPNASFINFHCTMCAVLSFSLLLLLFTFC